MSKRIFLIPLILIMALQVAFGQKSKTVLVTGIRYEYHPYIIEPNNFDLQYFNYLNLQNIHVGKLGLGLLFPIGRYHGLEWDVATVSVSNFNEGTLGFSFLGLGYRIGRGRVKGTISLDLLEFVLGKNPSILSSAALGLDCYLSNVFYFSLNIGTTYGPVYGLLPFVGISLKKDY